MSYFKAGFGQVGKHCFNLGEILARIPWKASNTSLEEV
ncbi:hypothetical protein BPO_1258 [Bergeyella porcorum]|uniref:Uncharacterized protein n=1 Tax=Bergeyella porcorum TaxID=1735111 RepID=A0AAU0F0R1_9FLAO